MERCDGHFARQILANWGMIFFFPRLGWIVVYEKKILSLFVVLKEHHRRPNFRSVITELYLCQWNCRLILCPFLVWGLRYGDETVIASRHCAWIIGKFDRDALAFLQARVDELILTVQKSFVFYVHRHGTHDQIMRLNFLFLDQF